MGTRIWVKTQFIGWHHWPHAPGPVEYLRHSHRHLFKVRCTWDVGHSDRDLEFHTMQRRVEDFIAVWKDAETACAWSCEQWAEAIGSAVGAVVCEVSEDGECGAEWVA